MNHTKYSILLILSCFIGQSLVGCNVGVTNNLTGNKLINNKALTNTSKVNGIVDFNEANSDDNLWINQTSADGISYDSRTNFQVINNSELFINLVGCNDNDSTIDTKHLNSSFSFTSNTVETSKALQAARYPTEMLDPKNFESQNYIRFKNINGEKGEVTCYLNALIPGSGFMYFKMVIPHYTAITSTELEEYLDHPRDYAQKHKEELTWYETVMQYGTATLGSMTTALLLHDWKLHFIDWEANVAFDFNEEMIRMLNQQIKSILDLKTLYASQWGTPKKYGEQLSKLLKNLKTSINGYVPFTDAGIDYDCLSRALDVMQGFKVDGKTDTYSFDSFESIDKDRTMHVKVKNLISKKIETIKIKDIDVHGFNNIEKIENFKDILKDLDLTTSAGEKELTKRMLTNFGKNYTNYIYEEDLIGYRSLHLVENLAKIPLDIMTSIGWFVLCDYLIHLGKDEQQGFGTTGLAKLYFDEVTPQEVQQWNIANPKNQINNNTKVSKLIDGPNHHYYQINFKQNLGFNTQQVLTLSASVATEPFYRPELIDGKDPYLGILNSNNKHDAVVNLSFSSNNINKNKNDTDDRLNRALIGFGELHGSLLPQPTVNYIEMTNSKTGQKLQSKANGSNNIQLGNIKGLAFNTGQIIKMQVTLPKAESLKQMGSSNDLLGSGFGAKFIEESSTGSMLIDEINSSDYEKLVTKLYTESPELTRPYLYSEYTCDYPTKVGDTCELKMHLGGMDNDKHLGKIYIADGASRTTAIPVYLNYHLLGSYFELNVSDKTSPYKIDIMNTHNEAYTKMTLEYKSVDDDSYKSVPMDMLAKDTTCNLDSGLQPRAQCSIYFDFSKLDSDSYQFRINGIKSETKLGTPDWFDIKVRVN